MVISCLFRMIKVNYLSVSVVCHQYELSSLQVDRIHSDKKGDCISTGGICKKQHSKVYSMNQISKPHEND